MILTLSYNLLVALEHSLNEEPGLLAELKSALGGSLGQGRDARTVAIEEDLLQRVSDAIANLEKRSWLQPFFGPLTAGEIKQQWTSALAEAERGCQSTGGLN